MDVREKAHSFTATLYNYLHLKSKKNIYIYEEIYIENYQPLNLRAVIDLLGKIERQTLLQSKFVSSIIFNTYINIKIYQVHH